jgi:transcriptional regulator with XRE-family HTH domain
MTTITLDQFLDSRGLRDDAGIEDAYQEALKGLPLAALRAAAQMTQDEMAAHLGKSQAAISKFEGRGDFLLSTLFEYVRALRGSIDVAINVAGESYSVEPTEYDGSMFFKLACCAKAKERAAITKRSDNVIRLRRQYADVFAALRPNSPVEWQRFTDARGYEAAELQLSSLIAANDETESVAARSA